jgi:hypothetical protein
MRSHSAGAAVNQQARRKQAAAQENGKKGGLPPKIHTLKKACPFPECKITNGHEHIDAA